MISQKANSILAEMDLLKELISGKINLEADLYEKLLGALSSQAKLASLECESRGIVSMSLNTHKLIANKELAGGYSILNTFRKQALLAIQERKKPDKSICRGSIVWYRNQLKSQNKVIRKLSNEIALMSQKLDEYMLLAHHLAIEANMLDLFKIRQKELLRKFG